MADGARPPNAACRGMVTHRWKGFPRRPTFLETQLGLAEAWPAPADPLSAWLGGAGSYTVSWYVEG